MSISDNILKNFPNGEIDTIRVNKEADLHGQSAVEVVVGLANGLMLTSLFAKEARAGFGGVQFSSQKDIAGLVTAKIESLLRGRAE